MNTTPIWRDYFVNYDTDDVAVRYRVECDGAAIFTGKAYKRPGETSIAIKLNDICAPYLSQSFDLPATEAATFAPAPYMRRVFTVIGEDTGAQLDEVEFYLDYSFEAPYNALTAGASFPITGEVDPRQWLVASSYDSTNGEAVVTTAGAAASAWKQTAGVASAGSLYLPLALHPGATEVTAFGRTYRVVESCPRFVLYYVNAFGGWDSLLVKGSAKETDTYTRATFRRTYDNARERARGTVNYANPYEKSFKLSTGWLTDEQAARMHHLTGSTNVLLCDLNSGEWWPVVLTDSSVEYKQHLTEGKPISYTLSATVAQNFDRR